MSRTFSNSSQANSAIVAALDDTTVIPCYFIEITGIPGEDDVYMCTYEHDLTRTIDTGTVTFVGAGDIMSISQIKEPSDLQSNGINIRISGLNEDIFDIARNVEYQQSKFRLGYAHLEVNADDVLFPSTYSGEFPCVLFAGRIDSIAIQDSGATCTMDVSIENRLATFERTDHKRYTHQDMIARAQDSGDMVDEDHSYQYVPIIQKRVLKWKAAS